jgi:hypothetical protein
MSWHWSGQGGTPEPLRTVLRTMRLPRTSPTLPMRSGRSRNGESGCWNKARSPAANARAGLPLQLETRSSTKSAIGAAFPTY